MITCLIGVAVLAASAEPAGSAPADMQAARPSAASTAAALRMSTRVPGCFLKCASIGSSLSDVSPLRKLGVVHDSGDAGLLPGRESFVKRPPGNGSRKRAAARLSAP